MRKVIEAIGFLPFAVLFVGCACWPCHHARPKPGPMPPDPEHPVVTAVGVEDAVEAALLEQETGLRPIKLVDGILYYVPDPEVTVRLADLGYQPSEVDGARVYERLMVATGGSEEELREAEVTVLLREKNHRVVHGTIQQLRVLARLGVRLEPARREPRPRQVRVRVGSLDQVRVVAESGVDVYSAGPVDADPETEYTSQDEFRVDYVVYGGAFDDAIERLREQGIDVEILPDPPEVER